MKTKKKNYKNKAFKNKSIKKNFKCIKPLIYNILGFNTYILPSNNNTFYIKLIINNLVEFETKNNCGISHLIEHYLFHTNPDIDNFRYYLKTRGISSNASTDDINVDFYFNGLDEYFYEILKYIINIIFYPDFYKNSIHLDTEKEAVRNELLNIKNDIMLKDYEKFNNIYSNNFQFSIDQQLNNLKKINIKMLEQFYNESFTKKNIQFVISIDIKKFKINDIKNFIFNLIKNNKFKNYPKSKFKLIKFSNLTNNDLIKIHKKYYKFNNTIYSFKNDKLSNYKINIICPILIFDNDINIINLKVISQYLNYALFKNLRTNNNLVYSVSVGISTYYYGSHLYINTSYDDKNKTRKKREELSVSASKMLIKESCIITVKFT